MYIIFIYPKQLWRQALPNLKVNVNLESASYLQTASFFHLNNKVSTLMIFLGKAHMYFVDIFNKHIYRNSGSKK